MKAAGLNGFTKSVGMPAGDGSGAEQHRPAENQPVQSSAAEPCQIVIGPVSSGDFNVLYNLVSDKAAQLGNIPVNVA